MDIPPTEPRPGPTYHLGLRSGDLPACVLVPGDPDRATAIAESWEEREAAGERREFRSFRGRFHGVPVGTVSAGIGGPSMAIVVEELARIGVRTILRVGSCGALQPELRAGDLAISRAAVRFEAASRAYAPPEYPAVADAEVVGALVGAARLAGVRFHVGITATVDSFYLEQGRPGWRGFVPVHRGGDPVEALRALGCMNVEMECATLLTIASLYGLRAGAVCTVFGDDGQGMPVPADVGPSIRVANEALRRLALTTT
ncbi:MAG: nucleoside phosphorylase [Thermoplasmata archaeon]